MTVFPKAIRDQVGFFLNRKSTKNTRGKMALLDTPQAMYGSMTSQYQLMQQQSYYPLVYRDYDMARFNIQQRLQPTSSATTSPEYQRSISSSSSGLKEEVGAAAAVAPITVLQANSSSTTAFRPYSSPGQENLPHHHHTTTTTAHLQAKVDLPHGTTEHLDE